MPPEYVLTSRPAAPRQVEPLQQLVGAGLDGLAAHAEQVALQDEVLPPGGHRVAAGILRDDADHPAYLLRLPEHVEPLDDGRPLGRAAPAW